MFGEQIFKHKSKRVMGFRLTHFVCEMSLEINFAKIQISPMALEMLSRKILTDLTGKKSQKKRSVPLPVFSIN
jgi:hypothetical protein